MPLPLVKCLVALACAAAAAPAFARPAPEPSPLPGPPTGLDFAPVLAGTGVASVSVARIANGRIAWVGAWGNQAPGVPATPGTVYNVASLTKPVAAETMVRAVAAGRLALDESMAAAWVDPDLRADPRHTELTLRHALNHRTGFPNWRPAGGPLAFARPLGSVGYSGEGFEYAARYAERRSGTPFTRLADQYVLGPAGLRETAFTRCDWMAGREARPTDGEGNWLEPQARSEFSAADDLLTTARDYARFLISVAGHQGMDAALAAERERVQGDTRPQRCTPAHGPTCPDQMGFGLGWDVAVFGEDRILWHTGADRGEWAFAYIVPRTGEGMVILTNSAVGWKAVLPIFERVGIHPLFLAFLEAEPK